MLVRVQKCSSGLFSFPGKLFIGVGIKTESVMGKTTSEGAKKWTITYATCAFYMLPSSNGNAAVKSASTGAGDFTELDILFGDFLTQIHR